MIEVERVSKRFGRVRALDGVSFSVGRGEVVGFLGPNGAGKTTTLRIVAGFLAADAGRVRVDGIDVAAEPRRAQARLGYLPEGAPLYDDMRVGDYLAHRARLKDAPRARIGAALAAAQVSDAAARRIGTLSRGTRQRVGLADALLADPAILVLDEPTAGLDPNQVRDARALLAELARERTVLVSTHILSEVEAIAARVVVLVEGRVVADRALADLGGSGTTRARVGDAAAALAALGDGATADGDVVTAPLPADEVARRLVAAGVAVHELGSARASLAEAFTAWTRPPS